MISLGLVAALTLSTAAPRTATATAPIQAPVQVGPAPWIRGTGTLTVGATFTVLSLGAGVTGIVLGGSPGLLLTASSMLTSALGSGLLLTGSWLHARHEGWYGEQDARVRVRAARRVGWPLFGVGLGLLVGSGVALAVWPFGPGVDDGAPALYPAAFATVESVFVLAPLLLSAGASALTWSAAYPRERGRRLELQSSVGGLRLRF